MKNDNWLTDRVAFLKGLKSRTDQQELIVLLAENDAKTPQDAKKLTLLVKAEKANIKAAKARQDASNLINSEKKVLAEAARKSRTHNLCESAGLLGLAGLLNTETGIPTLDRGELLGGLVALANTTAIDRAGWKRIGETLLAKTQVPVAIPAATAPAHAASVVTAVAATPVASTVTPKPPAPPAFADAFMANPEPAVSPGYKAKRTVAVPTMLNTRYDDKDEVKSLGAIYEAESKKWIVPAGHDLVPFEKWL